MTRSRPIALLTVIAAVVALSGCTGIADDLRNESASGFTSTAELAEKWEKTASWVPSDATDIRIRESTAGDPAILVATTTTDLDPAECAETDRQSAPVYEASWSPDSYVDRIFVCGDWAIIPTDDGWFGWTPNDPDEKAASPGQDAADAPAN